MEQLRQHEGWVSHPDVQAVLLAMLEDPSANFADDVQRLLPGGLRYAHAIGLGRFARAIANGKWSDPWIRSTTRSSGVAYHTWLFHFLGGKAAKLRTPPAPGEDSSWSRVAFSNQGRADTDFRANLKRLQKAMQRCNPSEQQELQQQLLYMRCRQVPVELLQLCAAGGGSTPPPVGSTSELELQKSRLLAFAMGTHDRLGFGYSSRQEPCGVRLLAGKIDLLRCIASFVRGQPPRTLAPPCAEIVRLRALNIQLERERHCFRDAAEEAGHRMIAAEAAERRALAREAGAHKRIEAALCAASAAVDEAALEYKAQSKKLEAALRKEKNAHKQTQVEMQLMERRMYNEGTDRVRATVAELREQNQLAAAARDAAAADAVARGETAAELRTTLERLRSTTKAGLLEEVAAQREKIRQLSERRKAGQRTLKEAALDRHRAHQSAVKARQLEMSFKESAVRAEARNSEAALVDKLERELAEARALQRRKRCRDAAGGSNKSKGGNSKRKRGGSHWVEMGEWGWDSREEFVIDRLIGKMVVDGETPVPGREIEKFAAGTVLYRVLWEGWPPELATWEEENQIPCGEVDFVGDYEASLDAEEAAEEDAESASEDES